MRNYLWMLSFLLIFACKCDSGEVSNKGGSTSVDGVPAKSENAASVAERQPSRIEAETRGTEATGEVGTVTGKSLTEEEMKKEIEKGDYYVDKSAVKVPSNNRSQGKVDSDIPSSCDLLGEAFMTKEFKIKDGIMINDATNSKSAATRSCFFRWDNGILPNSGIYLQIMGNPVPDEVQDYAMHYINGKLKGGEMDMSGTNFPYKKFDVVGDDGAYSKEQGRYYWRVEKEYVFMLAFNLGMGSNTEYKHATNIAKEVMKNYNALPK